MTDTQVSSGGHEAAPPPTTFAEAFAREDSPPSPPTTDSGSPAPAAAQPTETSAVPHPSADESPEDRSPFIPRARFDEVYNDRKALKTWKEERAWAESVKREQFEEMARYYGQLNADPQAAAFQILDALIARSPDLATALRSEYARRLGQRGQARDPQSEAPPDQMPDPDVAITDAQGQVIGKTYSADQLAKRDAYLRAQIQAELDAKYAPHFSTLSKIQQDEQQRARAAEAEAFGKSLTAELETLPQFVTHKAEIARALEAMSLTSDHPAEIKAAAYQAYLKVVGPKLAHGGKTTEDVVADLQRKAHAASSVNPGAVASTTPKGPRSFHEIPADQW